MLPHCKDLTKPHPFNMSRQDLQCILKIRHHLASLDDGLLVIALPVDHIQLLHSLGQGDDLIVLSGGIAYVEAG